MPTSPLSSAQAARQAVATRLQGLMKDAGLSGHELAVRCGWHRAKSSRIARGITPPSDADIRAWCSACGADGQAADLIAASRNAESMYVEWRQIHKDGMRRVHEQTVPLYQRTRSFRVSDGHWSRLPLLGPQVWACPSMRGEAHASQVQTISLVMFKGSRLLSMERST